jgi:hypothetical protein
MRKYSLLAIVAAIFLLTPAAIWAQEMSPEKAALYTRYYDLKKGGEEGQKQAYEVAKEFLQKYGTDDDQYTKAVKNFVVAYEKLSKQVAFYKAYNSKDYAKTYEIGRQILSTEPEDFSILGTLSRAGYLNAFGGNTSLNSEAVGYVKKAIELVEASKVTKPDPFANIDEARGFLNYGLGYLLRDQSPIEAEKSLIKAGQFDNTKNEPTTYYYLGVAILKGEYDPLANEYQTKNFKGETSESKAMFERLAAIGNRAIDAYARAVALSTKPQDEKLKIKWLEELTDLYKGFHNKSEAGLSELIAGVLSKPFPQ